MDKRTDEKCSRFALSAKDLQKDFICDPLWKNRPLTIFHENCILGMDRHRIYCRVQQSKSQFFKKAPKLSYGQKIVHGHQCLLSLQFFFEKQSIMYVHSSTFPYTLNIMPHGLFTIMNLPSTGHQYSSLGLKEKISREAMDSTLRKLSIIIRTAKTACKKHSWVLFFDNTMKGIFEIFCTRCESINLFK